MKKENITLVIHPTEWEDYDILAIGSLQLLTEFAKVNKEFYLSKSSKF